MNALVAAETDGFGVGALIEEREVAAVAFECVGQDLQYDIEVARRAEADDVCRGLFEGGEAGLDVGGADQLEEIEKGEVEGGGEVGEGDGAGEERVEEGALLGGGEGLKGCGHGGIIRILIGMSIGFCTVCIQDASYSYDRVCGAGGEDSEPKGKRGGRVRGRMRGACSPGLAAALATTMRLRRAGTRSQDVTRPREI